MNRLHQRCNGVARVLDDYNIKYFKEYGNEKYLRIFGTPYHIEISNKYISVSYEKNHYCYYLPSFEGITEFRDFVRQHGTNFKKLENEG